MRTLKRCALVIISVVLYLYLGVQYFGNGALSYSLREKIVDYVIHDQNKIVVGNVRSCRLVSKTWLQSTSAILHHRQEPLFRFKVFTARTIDCGILRKTLNGARLLDDRVIRVPPFALNISQDSALAQTRHCQQQLEKLMLDFGNGLTELAISTAQKLMLPGLQTVLLPKLRRLTVFIHRFKVSSNTWNDKVDKILQGTQAVFEASPHIKSFIIFHRSHDFIACVPNTFEKLRLPASLTEVSLDFELNATQLDVLLKNPLPNLRALKLHFDDDSLKDGTLTGILECFSKTLEQFHVTGAESLHQYYPASFQLPFMEKLKSLRIETLGYLDLNGDCSSLQQFLPKLNHLTLGRRTVSMLQKWIDQSCFLSVTSLTLSLCHEPANSTLSVGLCTMEKIKKAFPNLRELDILLGILHGMDLPEFHFITREMRNLQCLRISGARAFNIENSDFWDALLIGIPVECVAELQSDPTLWEGMQARSTDSLRNLSELHTLELGNGLVEKKNLAIISDATFQFALLKMPKMRTLIFKKNFYVSKQMREMWANEGRTICSPCLVRGKTNKGPKLFLA